MQQSALASTMNELNVAVARTGQRPRLRASTALTLGLSFLMPAMLQAQVVWDGDTDTDFNLNANWVGNVRPNAAQDALINGTGTNEPTLSADKKLNSATVAAKTLTVNATLETTAGTSTTGTGAIVVSATGRVVGGLTLGGGASSSAGRIDSVIYNSGGFSNIGQINATLDVNANGASNGVTGTVNGNVTVDGGTMTNDGALGNNAADTVTVGATGLLTNNGSVAGTLTNSGSVNNTGTIRAVVHNGGSFSNNNVITTTVTINADGFSNRASGRVNGNVNVTAGTLDNRGVLGDAGSDTVAVAAGAGLNNFGTGTITGSLTTGGTVANAGAVNGNVTVTAGTLTNNGTLGNATTDTVAVAAGSTLSNTALGSIAGRVNNSGTFGNAGSVNVVVHNAGIFSNIGIVQSTLNVNANGVTNQAAGRVNGNVAVTAGTMTNLGRLGDAGTDTVSVSAGAALSNTASGSVAGTLTNAGTFSNNGVVNALINNGAGVATNDGTITGTALVNNGTLINNADIGSVVQVAGSVSNAGRVLVDATVSGGAFTNASGASVGGTMTSSGGAAIVNAAGGIIGAVVHNGGAIANAGQVTGTLDVNAAGFNNQATGTVNGNVTIDGAVLVNNGTLGNAATDSVAVGATGNLDNNLTVAGTVTNAGIVTNDGTINAVVTTGAGLTTNNSVITGLATVNGGTLGNLGTVGAVTQTAGDVNNSGSVVGAATVSGGTFDNLAGGIVATLVTSGAATSTNIGNITGLATVNGGTLTNAAAGTIGALTSNGGSTVSDGTIVGNLSIAGGNVQHSGTVGGSATMSGGILGVTGGSIAGLTTNTGGTINIVTGNFTGGLSNTAGIVNARGTLTGNVINAGTFSLSGDLAAGAGGTFGNGSTGVTNIVSGSYTGLGLFTNGAGGIVTLGAGRTLGSATISNAGTFNATTGTIAGAFSNSGTVALTGNGTAGDLLTITGPVTGAGIYALDINLTTGISDQIDATAGGVSEVNLNFASQGGGVILAPVKVFSGVTNGVAFTQTGLPQGGTLVYRLNRNADNLRVVTSINPAVGGIAASAAMTQSIIGTVVNRPTSPFVSGLAAEEGCSNGGYFRASTGIATVTGTAENNGVTDSTEIDTSFYGAQGGYDIGCYDGRFFDGWDGAAGFMAGFNNGTTDQGIFSSPTDPSLQTGTSGSDFNQTYLGVYLAGSKDRVSGDLQLRFDSTDFTLSETSFGAALPVGLDGLEFSTDSTTFGARFNYRYDVNEEKGINFIPTIGFNYTSVTGYTLGLDGGTKGPGQTADDALLEITPYDTVVGFLGGTLTRTKISESGDSATTGFISGNYYQDFGGDRTAYYTLGAQPTDTIAVNSIGGFAEASIGLNYVRILESGPGGAKQLNANIRADARYGANVSDSYSLTAQVRISF